MPVKRKYQSDCEDTSPTKSPKRMHSNDDELLDENDENVEGLYFDDILIPPAPEILSTVNETGSRLIITRIVNTNFKSYGTKQVVGPFHKYFNAIVGPNGSGKSNVIDSVLFVFGFRASKIRSKNLSVLIHKSEHFPDLQSCSVAIHFAEIIDNKDDPNGYEVVNDTEFVVSRTVNKDNSSYYTLNDNRVQFKQIASLLRKYGIDLDHNRFLILQGEVEQISLMKPKALNEHETGMLEYLEDIIGTSRFKKPLQELDERIECLSQVREEKFNRVKLAQNEMNDLEGNMLEAVHFLEVENEVIKKRNFLYQRQIKQYHQYLKATEEENQTLLNKKTELKDSIKKITEEKKIKEDGFSDRKKEYDNLVKKKEEFSEMFNKANNRDITLQAEFQEINKRRKKIIEQIKEEKVKLESNEKIPERNRKKIEEFEGRESQLSTQCETLQAEKEKMLGIVRKETLNLQEKKEKLQTELIELKNVVDKTKETFSLAESQLKLFLSNEQKEREKLEILKKSVQNNKQKFNEHSKLLADIKRKLPETEKEYNQKLANLGRIRIEEARVIDEIKLQRVQMEEFRSSMQAIKSQGHVLDSLTQQKTQGNLPGLFGRLGDLGAIDKKYDVAVSTACGPLDNIVVDTVDTAQWCIEFLKKHNIGRATFIALDKQEHLQNLANSKINTPESVPRLYDLIKVEDNRVRTAFYFALRDTLVANDIEQATRIAYGHQRYRVVTLKGDLIETSGTMSGGGRSVLKGRMGQQVAALNKSMSPQKIQNLESCLTKLEEQARELNEKQTTLENDVEKLQSELRTLQIDKEKFSIEVQSLQKELPSLEKQVKHQEQVVKNSCANPVRVKELEAEIRTKRIKYDEANKNAEILQKKVDDLTKNINEIIDKKMKPINLQLKENTTTLEKLKAELVKLKVAIKTAERNKKKGQENITNMEQEKTEFENKLYGIQKQRKEIEEDAALMIKKIESFTEEIEEKKDLFGDEQNVVTELNKQLNKLKTEKLELDQKIKEVSARIKGNTDLVTALEKKLSQLKLNEIPKQNPVELVRYTDEELENTNTQNMEIELKREEKEIKESRPNLTAITDYLKKEAFYQKQKSELEELNEKKRQMKKFLDDMRKKRQTDFHAGFNVISTKLKEMYQLITLGGDAELEYVDSYDPFTEGIVLNVRPPKKSWKIITNLSGGEKTLSSLALVFALHFYKPSPLYFMDEIDAALDFKNVSIIGNYIKAQTKNAQFIIVSLRPNMFELADYLVGIYKTYNMTKCAVINPVKISGQDKQMEENSRVSIETRLSLNINVENRECEQERLDSGSLFDSEPVNSDNVSSVNATEGSSPTEKDFDENEDEDDIDVNHEDGEEDNNGEDDEVSM